MKYTFNIQGFDVDVFAECYEDAEYKALSILTDEHHNEYFDKDIISWKEVK